MTLITIIQNGNKHDKQDENGYRDVTKPETSKLIRETGEQSATLLKNTGGLPLNKPQRHICSQVHCHSHADTPIHILSYTHTYSENFSPQQFLPL